MNFLPIKSQCVFIPKRKTAFIDQFFSPAKKRLDSQVYLVLKAANLIRKLLLNNLVFIGQRVVREKFLSAPDFDKEG